MRNALLSLVFTGGLLVSATACDFPKACEGLSASAQDKEAAIAGYEVEREDSSGNTCELSRDGRKWKLDD